MNDERKKALQNLKTARGQIDGIIRMIEEGRYCIDRSVQMTASTALQKKAKKRIRVGHLHHYVINGIQQQDAQEKIRETESVVAAMWY